METCQNNDSCDCEHNLSVEVFYEDTDAIGRVYHANFLKYFDRARMKYMENEGISVKNLANDNKFFVVSNADISYKSPAILGDILQITSKIVKLTRVRLKFEQIARIENRIVVSANICLACINNAGKPLRIDLDSFKTRAQP